MCARRLRQRLAWSRRVDEQRDFSDPNVFHDYLQELEGLYEPPWSVYDEIAKSVSSYGVTEVYDYGCGTGLLAARLQALPGPSVTYYGLDIDPLRCRFAAKQRYFRDNAVFAYEPAVFEEWLSLSASAALVLSFCLHDQSSLDEILHLVDSYAIELVIAWDLTSEDLPYLTTLLRSNFGQSSGIEPRQRILDLRGALRERGYDIGASRWQTHRIIFPDHGAVMSYIRAFGIDRGADLALVDISHDSRLGDRLRHVLGSEPYPLTDLRQFLCVEAISWRT